MGDHHDKQFPGETSEYRRARDELLSAEIELRRQIERVAQKRRELPLGGEAPSYEFTEGGEELSDRQTRRTVGLSDLFEEGKSSLVVYSFMFGPEMEEPCPLCTSIVDTLNATAPHAEQRINLAVAAKADIERFRNFARTREWTDLRLISTRGTTYNRDYHAETESGRQVPALNVFVRRDGGVRHFYSAELEFASFDDDADPRHVDLIWPLWNLFDLTPEGRGEDWYPSLGYD